MVGLDWDLHANACTAVDYGAEGAAGRVGWPGGQEQVQETWA